MLYKDLSYQIIGCCMAVQKSIGPGLLEQPYHNALYYELLASGLHVQYNAPFNVVYRGYTVGEYFADLVVEGKIILELKSVKALTEVHQAQLINYLRISGCRVGYLLNFQSISLAWQRLVV